MKKIFKLFALLIIFVISAAQARAQISSSLSFDKKIKTGRIVPTRIIVKYRETPKAEDLLRVSEISNSKLKYSLKNSRALVIETEKKNREQVIEDLSQDPAVEDVFYDRYLDILYLPNDSSILATPAPNKPQLQWNLFNLNFANSGTSAWDVSKGSASVVVAVIDSGVDSAHEDLQGKFSSLVDCVSNCIVVSSMTSDPLDLNKGHGTHVAGLVAAATDNGIGIAGTGFNSKMMMLRVMDASGNMTVTSFVEAVQYAADHGAKVINMSLGAMADNLDAPTLTLITQAVNYAWNKGAVLVAAAGNCGWGIETHDPNGDPCDIYDIQGNFVRHAVNEPFYPAASPNVISVAAVDVNNNLAPYSQYNDPSDPKKGNWVTVAAPGGYFTTDQDKEFGIASTWPNDNYLYDVGTSMAAPQVSALAALIKTVNSGLNNAQVKSLIESTGNKNIVSGKTNSGLINPLGALQQAGGSPSLTPFKSPTPISTLPPLPTVTTLPSPTETVPTITPVACQNNPSDSGCFNVWLQEFSGILATNNTDFNSDGQVDLVDFEILRRALN